MKPLGLRKTRWGIAMTEYLIMLGIVAIGCIMIFGLFGSQIKTTITSAIKAMSGDPSTHDTTAKTAADTEQKHKSGMDDFDKASAVKGSGN